MSSKPVRIDKVFPMLSYSKKKWFMIGKNYWGKRQ